MKVKMSQILRAQNVYESIKNTPISIQTLYKIAKLFNTLNTEAEFYTNRLQTIAQKYGEKDEDGNLVPNENNTGVKIQPDKVNAAQKEIDDLLDLEIEVPKVIISLSELEGAQLTLENLSALLPFIEE